MIIKASPPGFAKLIYGCGQAALHRPLRMQCIAKGSEIGIGAADNGYAR